APVSGALTDEEIGLALKDTLANGVNRVADTLGRQGAFYGDKRLKIAFPAALAGLEKKLRDLKNDDLVDDLVVAMNRAAEQAAVETAYMLREALPQLALENPKGILRGAKDGAAKYFRRAGEKVLLARVTQVVMTSNFEAG